MTPKEAHESARKQAITCIGCGVASALVIEIPNPTPEQVAEARQIMLALKVYGEHGLIRLAPIEDHAERLQGRMGRRTAKREDGDE